MATKPAKQLTLHDHLSDHKRKRLQNLAASFAKFASLAQPEK